MPIWRPPPLARFANTEDAARVDFRFWNVPQVKRTSVYRGREDTKKQEYGQRIRRGVFVLSTTGREANLPADASLMCSIGQTTSEGPVPLV